MCRRETVTSNSTWNQSLIPLYTTKGLGHDWNLNATTLSKVKGPLSKKTSAEAQPISSHKWPSTEALQSEHAPTSTSTGQPAPLNPFDVLLNPGLGRQTRALPPVSLSVDLTIKLFYFLNSQWHSIGLSALQAASLTWEQRPCTEKASLQSHIVEGSPCIICSSILEMFLWQRLEV